MLDDGDNFSETRGRGGRGGRDGSIKSEDMEETW